LRIKRIIQLTGILLLLACGFCGCIRNQNAGKVSEGVIEYHVGYLQPDTPSGMSTSFLPRKMTMKFRKNIAVNSITGFLGMFELVNYADARKMTNTTYLKAGENKFSYTSNVSDPLCCFDPYDKMTIEMIADSFKTIAGYRCMKAIAHFPGTGNEDFDIYYTQDIAIHKPNMNNPFKDIDGVLMEFNLRISHIDMHITAMDVQARPVNSEEIAFARNGFKEISKKSMDTILLSLLK
jgi:GLPGLI family protein